MAKLIVRNQDGTEKEVPLDAHGSATIGRSPDCELAIDDPQASRRHCSVVAVTSGFELTDLGSTNGTTVNSQLVKRRKLRHGDVIRIGKFECVFDDPSSAGPSERTLSNCFLVFARGERKGQKIELDQQRTTLGRKETNTIVLKDPVASSYHCEIVRDLNGYTIRDLGSTNGTVVNGEMVTEAPLSHGSKIRIGNVLFVFEDPSLASVDLDLASAEEEEPEWGMLRDMDLAAVRRRNPANLVYLLLFLLIVGGGAYFVVTGRASGGATGPVSPEGNLLRDSYSFESEGSAFSWRGGERGVVNVERTTRVHAKGSHALELSGSKATWNAFADLLLDGTAKEYEVSGEAGAAGGTQAQVGIFWSGLGLSSWTFAPPIEGAGLKPFHLRASAPPWARSARLGVHAEGRGPVYLDDVVLLDKGSSSPEKVSQNNFDLAIVGGTDVTLSYAGAPKLAEGRPVARDAAGKEVSATLQVKASTPDAAHIRIEISGNPGKGGLLGLQITDISGFLSRGGFRAFGEGDQNQVYQGEDLHGTQIRKILVGPKGAAFSVLGDKGDALLSTDLVETDGRLVWTILGPATEGHMVFRIQTDLRGDISEAMQQIGRALQLYQSKEYGRFLDLAPKILQEFPFVVQSQRQELTGDIAKVNGRFTELQSGADQALRDYENFRDIESLDSARTKLQDMRDEFQIEPGQGPRGETYSKLLDKEQELRKAELTKRQKELAEPILEQATLINLPQDEVYSAAVLLSYVAWHLPESPQAAQAKEELAKIGKSHPEILKVLEQLEGKNGGGD